MYTGQTYIICTELATLVWSKRKSSDNINSHHSFSTEGYVTLYAQWSKNCTITLPSPPTVRHVTFIVRSFFAWKIPVAKLVYFNTILKAQRKKFKNSKITMAVLWFALNIYPMLKFKETEGEHCSGSRETWTQAVGELIIRCWAVEKFKWNKCDHQLKDVFQINFLIFPQKM